MQRSHRGLSYARRIVVLIIAGLQLSACQQKPDMPGKIEPVKRDYDGETLYRLRLTAKAAEEYKIKTEPVREVQVVRSGSKALRKVVPVAAVLSDGYGNTWTFTNPESLVFVRKRLRVDYIDGDLAVLSDGLPSGTVVVTVGAAELFGSESEFKEE